MKHPEDPQDPRMPAAIDLLQRTGMREFQLRYSDESEPVVWMAVGKWAINGKGSPVPKGGRPVWESASAISPLRAVLRLCDQMIDGGQCGHCGKPTGVTDEWRHSMPLSQIVCWYQYDPECKTFRRGCE